MLQSIIILPSDYEFTKDDLNVFSGFWIILTIIWLVTWIITSIQYFMKPKKNQLKRTRWDSEVLIIFDILIVLSWALALVFYLGYLFSSEYL